MPKKILIVTRLFHPEITPRAFRAYELAKEFSRQGHDVTVLTTEREFDYSCVEQCFGFCVKAIVKNEPIKYRGAVLNELFVLFLTGFSSIHPSC